MSEKFAVVVRVCAVEFTEILGKKMKLVHGRFLLHCYGLLVGYTMAT